MKITCDVEMSIARGFANFVGDDAFVDAAVCVTNRTDDQAVDVTDYRRKQSREDMKHTGPKLTVFNRMSN